MDYKIFKHVIKELIQFYYSLPLNGAGGNLHVELDDGNLSDSSLFEGQEYCSNRGDYLGYLIATVLRYFPENKREKMYNEKWGIDE